MRNTFSSLLLASAGISVATRSPINACGNEDVGHFGSCTCPPGTQFQNSVTHVIIGANAKDVRNITADFFDTTWVNTPLTSVAGPNNTPGSLRSFNIKTSAGTYPFTEQLLEFTTNPDGSFIQRLGQYNNPVRYSSKNGTLSGFWVTLESHYVEQYETAVKWSLFACFTGHPLDFTAFCKGALANVISTLGSRGLLEGETLGPFGVKSF